MLSTPPASTTRASPARISRAACTTDSIPEAQLRPTLWAGRSFGAATALKDHVKSPEEITRRVLEIVIDIDVDCPGEPLIQKIDQNGVLSEPTIA